MMNNRKTPAGTPASNTAARGGASHGDYLWMPMARARLPKEEVQHLREHVLAECAVLDHGTPLERFVTQALADDEVVEGYFYPRSSTQTGRGVAKQPTVYLPAVEALIAATAASESELLLQHDRPLAFAAALLYSCGLFHCTHPTFAPTPDMKPTRAYVAQMRGYLLEAPLAQLRRTDPALGQTMAEVLGMNSSGAVDTNAEQVSRITSVVHLANLAVMALGLR